MELDLNFIHRKLSHDFVVPFRPFFELTGRNYYKARNRWKQGCVGFVNADEYRKHHIRMV